MVRCLANRWLTGVVALGVALSAGCKDTETVATRRTAAVGAGGGGGVAVRLAAVERGGTDRTVDVVGTLVADQDAVISAKVPGRVVALGADVGDRIAAGGVLVKLDEQDYRLALQQREFALSQVLAELGVEQMPGADFDPSAVPGVVRARFEAENAAGRLGRVRKLFEVPSPLIPEQEFRDRQTEYEVAVRNLEMAELGARALLAAARTREAERAAAAQRLADAVVRAPESLGPQTARVASVEGTGVAPSGTSEYGVAERFVSVGEYVREGDRLFRIVSDSVMRLRAAVPERFVPQVAVGQRVRLRVEGHAELFEGVVRRIAPTIDPATRTFQVEADFPNESRARKAGAFGRGQIVVGRRDDVASVPSAAVVTFAGTDRVFSVSDGKAVEHVVRIVQRVEGRTVVEGLPPTVGEVVVEGTGRLARGVGVEVQ